MRERALRTFVAATKWTSLAKIGSSPIARLISLVPIFAVFLQYAFETPRIQEMMDDGGVPIARLSFSFVGLCVLGVGVIIFNIMCPALLRLYPSHLSYVALNELITKERYNQIVDTLALRSNRLVIWFARTDNGFWLDEGFINAKRKHWDDFEGAKPETEQVVRVLWYNYVFLDHCLPFTRMLVASLYIIGLAFTIPPSITTILETFGSAMAQILQ